MLYLCLRQFIELTKSKMSDKYETKQIEVEGVFFKATQKRWILDNLLIWSYSRMNRGVRNKYQYLTHFIHLLYNRHLSWLW